MTKRNAVVNHVIEGQRVRQLHDALLAWFGAVRRDLPWRRTRDPYAIWVSEVMLQQTQVITVIPYYERFLAKFPTVFALADASRDDVFSAWSGLGYYRRARMLHDGAQRVAHELRALPTNREQWLQIRGVGKYTAGAVASIAFGERVGLVDGNVARVFARVFGIEADMRKGGLREAEALAEALVAPHDPGAWNQALMELGATTCTPRAPACDQCPVAAMCVAHQTRRVDQLPMLGPKKAPKPTQLLALVARRRSDAGVLVVRRGTGGTFAGLWEPVMLECVDAESGEKTSEIRHALQTWLGSGGLATVASVKHQLSHRTMHVQVMTAEFEALPAFASIPTGDRYDQMRVLSPNEPPTLGLSTLAKKVLTAAGVDVAGVPLANEPAVNKKGQRSTSQRRPRGPRANR